MNFQFFKIDKKTIVNFKQIKSYLKQCESKFNAKKRTIIGNWLVYNFRSMV